MARKSWGLHWPKYDTKAAYLADLAQPLADVLTVTVPAVTAGQTVVATVAPVDANGNAVSTSQVVWSVTATDAVATIDPTSGSLTVHTTGGFEVVATIPADGRSGSTTVNTPTGTPTLTFNTTPIAGTSSALAAAGLVWRTGTVTAVHKDGTGAPTGTAVTYSSNNTGVATVNSTTGVVTAVAAGVAVITASAGGLTATKTVQVYSNDAVALVDQTGAARWTRFHDAQYYLTSSGGRLTNLGDVRGGGTVGPLSGLGATPPLVTGSGADLRIQTDGTQNYCKTAATVLDDISKPIAIVAGIDSTTGTGIRYPVLLGDVSTDYMAIGGASYGVENQNIPTSRIGTGGEGATAGCAWATGTRRLAIVERALLYGGGAAPWVQFAEVPNRLRTTNAPVETTFSAAASANRSLFVGSTDGSGGFNAVNLSFVGVRDNTVPLTPAEKAILAEFATSRNCAVDTTATKAFLFVGDSITYGTATSVPATKSWDAQLMNNGNWSGWDWMREAVDGRTIRTMLLDFDTKVLPCMNPNRTKNFAALFGGTNDVYLNGTSADTLIDYTINGVARLSAAGFGVIVVGTMFKRTANTAGQNTITDAFNTRLRALAPSLLSQYNCLVIDWAADARLANPADTTYYAVDGVHPNDAGSLVMAQLADAALASYR